jgi:hypothetical protein
MPLHSRAFGAQLPLAFHARGRAQSLLKFLCALFPSFCALLDRGRKRVAKAGGEGPAHISFIRPEETEDNYDPQDCTKYVSDSFSGVRLQRGFDPAAG